MAFVRFGGNIGLVGSGIQCLSSQILSKSSKNWFEKRTAEGTMNGNQKLDCHSFFSEYLFEF